MYVFFKMSTGFILFIYRGPQLFSIHGFLTLQNFWPCVSWVCNTLGSSKRDVKKM